MGPARGGSERASPRAPPAHSARSAPAGTGAAASAAAASGSPNSGPAAARGGARAVPGAGRRRPDRTETLLSALRRPRLPRPPVRAAAGRAAEPEDFSPVRGAPRGAQGTSAAVGQAAAPGPRQGYGARAARSVRAAAGCWRGGLRGLEIPGGGPEPSPRPASGAPASAPLFPPGPEAPSSERHWESSAGSGALAAPPGPERSPGAAGRSRGRGRPPAQATADPPEAEPQRRVR